MFLFRVTTVDKYHLELTRLLECKVAYEKCLAQLQEECLKNEALVQKQRQLENQA